MNVQLKQDILESSLNMTIINFKSTNRLNSLYEHPLHIFLRNPMPSLEAPDSYPEILQNEGRGLRMSMT